MKRANSAFDTSSKAEDADAQIAIRKWFVLSTLKNAFGSLLTRRLPGCANCCVRACGPTTPFPADSLYKSLAIEPVQWANRLGMVRRFTHYCSAMDPRTVVPPPDLLSYQLCRPFPYVYLMLAVNVGRQVRYLGLDKLVGHTHAAK